MILNSELIEKVNEKFLTGQTIHRDENPWFKGTQNVRKAGVVFEFSDWELDEYVKCKMDIHHFAETWCKIKNEKGQIGLVSFDGREYQREILDLFVDNRFSILMASRQIGKTISAAIFILWYATFHNDKNIMIIANKSKTTSEILEKIKNIYKHLPFFLKQGVYNWAARSLNFENGCRIMTEARTKEPAIGFTIDVLYLDEFAHIPKNIIEPYYRAAYPTVSSIEDSKIIITSTPNGPNLFHKLLKDAEREPGDPQKNQFHAKRVYWYAVPGRSVTYIKLDRKAMHKYDTDEKQIYAHLCAKYNISERSKLKLNKENGQWEIWINNTEDLTTDEIRTWEVDADIFEGAFEDLGMAEPINVNQIAAVTSWKEETIKNIGGEENFNQEYGLQFIASSKIMFDDITLANIINGQKKYEHMWMPEFARYPHINWESLKWVNDPEVLNINRIKDEYIMVSVDLSEGLGQDYSVVNLFKLKLRPEEHWEKLKVESIYDFFCVEQIGIFRHNLISIKSLAEFLYILFYDILDQDKLKVALEYNAYGGELLAHMPKLWSGNNQFSNHIFARYKHRIDAKKPSIGLKVSGNKPLLVKEYQQRVISRWLQVHEETTIREMSTFVKEESSAGRLLFRAESGHDDVVMTLVSMSTLYNNVGYKDLCDRFLAERVPEKIRRKIEAHISGLEYLPKGTIDYNILFNAKKQVSQNQFQKQNITRLTKNIKYF